jgi:hypothetical protein
MDTDGMEIPLDLLVGDERAEEVAEGVLMLLMLEVEVMEEVGVVDFRFG